MSENRTTSSIEPGLSASFFSHTAATPPGLTVTVQVRLDEVRGKRLSFSVSAHDGVDEICRGTHERYLIDTERFNAKVESKRSQALRGG